MQEIAGRMRDLSATMDDVYHIAQSRYAWEAIETLREFFNSPIFTLMQLESPGWHTEEAFRSASTERFPIGYYDQLTGMLVYLHASLPRQILEDLLRANQNLCAPWLVSDHQSFDTQDMVKRMVRQVRQSVDHSQMGNLCDDILYSGRSPMRVCLRWGLYEALAGERRRSES